MFSVVAFGLIRHVVSVQGPNQRRLYNDLMKGYNILERPVQNDSQTLTVEFGLSLMQIMDVVSCYASCVTHMLTMH